MGQPVDASGRADSAAADTAIELLRELADPPFFLVLVFLWPHTPFVAPSRCFDMFPLEEIEVIQNPADDIDDIPTPAKNLQPCLWHPMGMSEGNHCTSLPLESE